MKNRRIDVDKSALLGHSNQLVVGRFGNPGDAPQDRRQDANHLMLLDRKEVKDRMLELHGAYNVCCIGGCISI